MSLSVVRASEGLCLVCGESYRHHSRLPGLVVCPRCGFVSADLNHFEADLSALYSRDYFHGGEYRNYIDEGPSLRHNFQRRIETLRTLVPDLKNCDVFEIGCAYGFFLAEARSVFRSAAGIDIIAEGIDHATEVLGVPAMLGDYLTKDLGHKYDAITMWDTIEHLNRPDLFIAKARLDLKPGGIIAITTGDIASLNARWRGRRWRMIHPPTHLHYFSLATLTALLSRHGFRVMHVSHPGNSRALRSMLHGILALRMGRQHLYNAIEAWPILNLHLSFNLADIMYVIARVEPTD